MPAAARRLFYLDTVVVVVHDQAFGYAYYREFSAISIDDQMLLMCSASAKRLEETIIADILSSSDKTECHPHKLALGRLGITDSVIETGSSSAVEACIPIHTSRSSEASMKLVSEIPLTFGEYQKSFRSSVSRGQVYAWYTGRYLGANTGRSGTMYNVSRPGKLFM